MLNCILVVGTEEETGGDGEGEVSAGVECESVMLLPEDWYRSLEGPSIVSLRPTQAKLGVDSCWRRRSMRVYFVSNVLYSSITPLWLHVCDSFFPALDQYSGDLSSSLILATGHQLVSLCRSVEEEEKNQLLGPVMTS